MVVTPYKHTQISKNIFTRTFSADADNSDLCWHRDKQNRIIEVIEGEGWNLQLDNCIPMRLIVGREYRIPKEEYHRLIKGNTKLVLKITEIK